MDAWGQEGMEGMLATLVEGAGTVDGIRTLYVNKVC